MSEKFISSIHIQKLGHTIQEIRERTLKNIISKLDRGFVYDNDLARSKEILQKLFEWFLFEPCSYEETVLALIKRILQTESGLQLLKHFGSKPVMSELIQIRSYVESKFYPIIDEIIGLVKQYCDNETIVPPLQSDIPLSYRSDGNSHMLEKSSFVGSTATSIEGYIYHRSSTDQQTGKPHKNATMAQSDSRNSLQETSENSTNLRLPYCTLPWQHLITPDRHVLESVESSLKNPPQPKDLLHSCEFFIDVMIHDFPAEVFVQRPGIVLLFQQLLISSSSSRVTTAVLTCLLKLTILLETRISYYSDPCMHNLKQIVAMQSYSGACSPSLENESSGKFIFSSDRSAFSNESSENERPEDTSLLISRQMSLPLYCLNNMRHIIDYLYIRPKSLKENVNSRRNQIGVNIALHLFDKLVCLLHLCMANARWENRHQSLHQEILTSLNEVLIKFGDILENLRLEVMTSDFERTCRLIHLHLLHNCINLLQLLIPLDVVLPKNLKNALSSSLMDFTFSRLYPATYEKLLQFVQKFGGRTEKVALSKCDEVNDLCESMTSTINLLRNHTSMPIIESIKLAKKSLKCIEFHKNMSFVKIFVESCANKMPMHSYNDDVLQSVEDITLNLLAHNDVHIRTEMYKLCQKSIAATIGPRMNALKASAPGSQVLFLLRPQILIELVLHGMTSDINEIRQYAEDILIHILKCKILVSDDIWNSIVEALLPSLPILICHANKNSPLDRTVLSILDPDRAMTLHIATTEVLKGNACLLFTEDSTSREEAVSRLCWLLTSQDNNREFLPRLINLHDKALSVVCQLKHLVDLNKTRISQQFYQPSSLQQVLELLNSDNVEPIIRRSALTQISVMMEDYLMHKTFVEKGGVQIVIDIMKSALTEANFKDYPDSIIPAVSTIKNLCLHVPSIRQELSNNLELYYWILRGLFLYCTEDRMKQEGSILLFLLLFNNFINGTPSRNDFAIPELVIKRLRVPFVCNTHSKDSKHTPYSLTDLILKDKWCLQSIQIHWNSEWFGGFEKLLNWNKINYNDKEIKEFPGYLQMCDIDLITLQSSSLEYCVDKYMQNIENASNHEIVIDSLGKLTGYINLYIAMKSYIHIENDLLSASWEKTFMRFLNVLPSSTEDIELLICILKFLNLLIPLYKYSEAGCWITQYLKEENNCLVKILLPDYFKESHMKNLNLSKELLNLITTCVCNEQHYLDFHNSTELNEQVLLNWSHVIEIIAENLKFSDAQHFYNLAYLDSLLSCLVHLTATLNWSNSKSNYPPSTLLVQLVTGLCEMIGAFHCGKGSSAAASIMGISITRHAILILNHLLVEIQHSNVKGWETCFIEEESGVENTIINLSALWSSRDVILRAAVFQLFSGLALSKRGAIELVQEIKNKGSNLWETSFVILLDHEESSIVRENIANMLSNLISHTNMTATDGFTLDVGVSHSSETSVKDLMKLLSDLKFYKELILILSSLYTSTGFYFDESISVSSRKINNEQNRTSNNFLRLYSCVKNPTNSSSSRTDTANNGLFIVATPSLIKAVSNLLHNIMVVAPIELSTNLHEHGLITLFFRSLCIPELELHTTKDLALYCDILEMNAAICAMLNKAMNHNSTCRTVILHTRDGLNFLLSLLNPSIYFTNLSQLVYLRNKVWTEIFSMLGILAENGSNYSGDAVTGSCKYDSFSIVSSALIEYGQGQFMQTLCEAISNNNSIDLQQSALCALTSLLKMDITLDFKEVESHVKFQSIRNLLDDTRTPKSTPVEEHLNDNTENIAPNRICNTAITKSKKILKNSFENIYLEKLLCKTGAKLIKTIKSDLNGETLVAGAKLCKILLDLLDVVNVQNSTQNKKKKALVLNALTSILCVSCEAKKFALQNGLLEIIMQQMRELCLRLSLESIESLRRVSDKKRLGVILKEINSLIGLMTNFMFGDMKVKSLASILGLADLTHKIWIWLCTQSVLLIDALKMMCTYTTDCLTACQSLSLTSSVAGSGPRKAPSNISLLHAIISLIYKEMDRITRSHDLMTLDYCFQILHNSCCSTECRIILSKSNFLQCLSRLHPAITKRQKPWESVELIWLEFLQTFTCHPEGQAICAKTTDVLELIMTLTNSTKLANRRASMIVLRNISFYHPNRPKLLTSGDFLNILDSKLTTGCIEEKNMVVTIMWSLCANNQKAKLVFKCARLDVKLQETLKILHLSPDCNVSSSDFDRMHYVLNVLKENDKR